ncbi:MAG: hypothetical protein ACREBE_23950 [bacterium]
MRKFIPFLLAGASLFAVLGVLFLVIRADAMPARVRTLRWRTDTASAAAPVDETVA